MAKIRVHELAARIGRQNREVIEALKEKGVEVKSHIAVLTKHLLHILTRNFYTGERSRLPRWIIPEQKKRW